MKNIFYHTIGILFACLWFTSCEQEIISENAGLGEGVTLSLRLSSNNLQSRAEAGDNNYNENAITKVDLYLYPEGGSGQAKCKISKTFSASASTENLTESLNSTEKEALFGSGTGSEKKCHAYALVNYNGTAPAANTDASTIAALKALEIEANFTQTQTSFVMDGESSEITYNGTNQVTGTIFVSRAASKISLFVTGVDKNVKDDAGNTWIPDYTKMDIAFYNGVNKSVVDGGYSNSRPVNTLAAANIYETSGIRDITATLTETTETAYKLDTSHDPFYSYSYDWKNAADDKKPTITLMVPWRKEGDTEWKTCYYQIPVNIESKNGSLTDCFERNMYYKINLHVGILGEFDPNNPTVIPASYYTVEWKDQDVNVDIKNYKYLVVDKNDVTVYNEPDCIVNYITSDDVSVQILSITKPDYSGIQAAIKKLYTYNNGAVLTSTNGFILTAENGVLKLHHTLDNNINSSAFDYVPYTVKVKIWHTNAPTEFVEEIEIVQYPAVYVVNSLNEGTTDTRNTNSLVDNSYTKASGFGYVMVNTLYENRYDYNNYNYGNIWQTVEGFDSSSKNPNMYIVTTTALDSSLDYLLGDSREAATYTYSQLNTGESKDVNGETLQKYRPTKTDRDDYLSPKFRISSAYGQLGTNQLTHAEAKKRCATYQEYGYPAGRWRLASKAELEYIAILCQYKALPQSLFGASTYWGATDRYKIDTSDGEIQAQGADGRAYLRCVYDDWYWGSNSLDVKTKFTWGDQMTTEELNTLAK